VAHDDDKLSRKAYERDLVRLHLELVKLQYGIKRSGERVVLLFEGRDSCPEFERMLVRDGDDPAQVLVLRLRRRAGAALPVAIEGPLRRWKLSLMDLESRSRWVEFSRAKDQMLVHTHTPEAPWHLHRAHRRLDPARRRASRPARATATACTRGLRAPAARP
jgi:polyphosphate kinase 2 (PPK2 family)